jgi:hypothetical protein
MRRPYCRVVATVIQVSRKESLVVFTPKMIVPAMPMAINAY